MKATLFERLLSKKYRLNRLKKKVIQYLSGLPDGQIDSDQKEILEYLKANDISVFPYRFIKDYFNLDVGINFDHQAGLLYSFFEGKKLYYKNGSQERKAVNYFRGLLVEQDARSPHRYLSGTFDVEPNDIVVDVGAAEGNFSLSVIEKAKHVYLFEPDQKWIKALESTFAPWKDKVTIVNKFVSDVTDPKNNVVCLNDYFSEGQTINFLKADVEGAEMKLLLGAKNIFKSSPKLKVAICTYHNQDDASTLEDQLSSLGFSNSFSKGYMLYYYGRSNVVQMPYLRKAVLRGIKRK